MRQRQASPPPPAPPHNLWHCSPPQGSVAHSDGAPHAPRQFAAILGLFGTRIHDFPHPLHLAPSALWRALKVDESSIPSWYFFGIFLEPLALRVRRCRTRSGRAEVHEPLSSRPELRCARSLTAARLGLLLRAISNDEAGSLFHNDFALISNLASRAIHGLSRCFIGAGVQGLVQLGCAHELIAMVEQHFERV